MRHAQSIYSHGSQTDHKEELVRIGYYKLKILEYEFKYILPMVCDTPARHLRNET